MELQIGRAIRKLRKEKDVTQEELASAIGVTAQAVSKWERNEGYPDITLMPKIAHFFDTTMDAVCGMGDAQEQRQICGYHNAIAFAPYDKSVSLAREAMKKFPHSYQVKEDLADALTGCLGQWTPPKEIWDEVIALYEDILSHCTEPDRLNRVRRSLCRAYGAVGDMEKARVIAKDLPSIGECREAVLSTFLTGQELVERMQWSMGNLLLQYHFMLGSMAAEDWYSPEEKIILYRKMIAIYEIAAEEGEWNIGVAFSINLYRDIAACYLEVGNPTDALVALEKAAELAVHGDSIDPEKQKRSLLRNHPEVTIYSEQGDRKFMREYILADARFDEIRHTTEFQRILDIVTEE